MASLKLEQKVKWFVKVEDSFDFYSADYIKLFEASDTTAFQAPGWLHSFYTKLAEQKTVVPLIVTLTDDTGNLRMLLPCIKQTFYGLKIVQPADLGVSDCNRLIIDESVLKQIKDDQDLKEAIFAALKPYDIFLFRKQRHDKLGIEEIFEGGTSFQSGSNSHEVLLETPYEEWALKNLSRNFRSSNRSKMRKLAAKHVTYEFETVTDPLVIEEALRFIQLHRGNRYEDDTLKQEEVFDFYLSVATKHAEDGFAQTFVLRVEGEIVAAFFGLNHNDVHSYLLGSFHPGKMTQYSLGLNTLDALIKDRVGAQYRVFDFGLGDEVYKDRFGAHKVDLYHVVYAGSFIGELICFAYSKSGFLKKLVKNFDVKA